MSGLLKLAGKVLIDPRGVETGLSMQPINSMDNKANGEPTASNLTPNDKDTLTQGLSMDEWEAEAGFDEVVEPGEQGLRDCDEPAPGVIEQGAIQAKKRSAPTNTRLLRAEGTWKKFAPKSFQF